MSNENPYESPKTLGSVIKFNEKKTFRALCSLGYGGITIGVSLVTWSYYHVFSLFEGNEKIAAGEVARRISEGRIICYGGLAFGVLGIILLSIAILIRLVSKRPRQ
jgi:hypothetical protein